MGLNYHLVVHTLFEFKDRLEKFSTPKNLKVLEYFQKTAYNFEDEDAHTPQLKEITQLVDLPRTKVNEIIKDFYNRLIESFSYEPIEIKRSVVTIHIAFTWEEQKELEKTEAGKEFLKQQLSIDVNLPIIPRVGEDIRLDFLDFNSRFAHGCVYRISHEFTGRVQRTTLWVHPTKNHYNHWMKLKSDYERWEKGVESERRFKSGLS
jgi:hypothetical protein